MELEFLLQRNVLPRKALESLEHQVLLLVEYHRSKVFAMANLHSLFEQELIQMADDANIWWQSSRRGARTAGGEDIKIVKG